jgi:hypothetical protein
MYVHTYVYPEEQNDVRVLPRKKVEWHKANVYIPAASITYIMGYSHGIYAITG